MAGLLELGGTHWHVGHSWYRLRRRIREAKRRGVA